MNLRTSEYANRNMQIGKGNTRLQPVHQPTIWATILTVKRGRRNGKQREKTDGESNERPKEKAQPKDSESDEREKGKERGGSWEEHHNNWGTVLRVTKAGANYWPEGGNTQRT